LPAVEHGRLKSKFVTQIPKKVQCIFEFDLGATLRTAPYDRKGEHWVLHTPEQKALTLRADRRYQYMRSDLP
jgi:hypothetical protein